jgi:prophage antirepressor-like protein
MSVIIDIFNNLLRYNDKQIFILLDIDNNIWFKIKDILIILGYYNITKINRLTRLDKKYICKFKYIKVGSSTAPPFNMQPNTQFINESGLYQILSHSKKKLAEKFRDELFINILPSIRKTGSYKMSKNNNDKLKKLNEKLVIKIKKIKEENNYYEDKHIYKPTKKSYIYILQKNIGRKKCFKIGYSNNIKKRMLVYKTGKSNIELIYYISIIFDGKQTEECIKNINKIHKLKNKTDDLCYLSLLQLKESIKDCLDKFTNHICKCVHCKKKLKFKNIDLHICK